MNFNVPKGLPPIEHADNNVTSMETNSARVCGPQRRKTRKSKDELLCSQVFEKATLGAPVNDPAPAKNRKWTPEESLFFINVVRNNPPNRVGWEKITALANIKLNANLNKDSYRRHYEKNWNGIIPEAFFTGEYPVKIEIYQKYTRVFQTSLTGEWILYREKKNTFLSKGVTVNPPLSIEDNISSRITLDEPAQAHAAAAEKSVGLLIEADQILTQQKSVTKRKSESTLSLEQSLPQKDEGRFLCSQIFEKAFLKESSFKFFKGEGVRGLRRNNKNAKWLPEHHFFFISLIRNNPSDTLNWVEIAQKISDQFGIDRSSKTCHNLFGILWGKVLPYDFFAGKCAVYIRIYTRCVKVYQSSLYPDEWVLHVKKMRLFTPSMSTCISNVPSPPPPKPISIPVQATEEQRYSQEEEDAMLIRNAQLEDVEQFVELDLFATVGPSNKF